MKNYIKEKHAKRRKNNVRKALRKRKITEEVYNMNDFNYYNNLHQYSKNKIHCSCGLCASKTNKKHCQGIGYGRNNSMPTWKINPITIKDENDNIIRVINGVPNDRKTYAAGSTNNRNGKNWSVKDKKKVIDMNEQILEYECKLNNGKPIIK